VLTYDIVGRGGLELATLVLDLNGTIATDGLVIPGVKERLRALQECGLRTYLLTADTRGRGAETAKALGLTLHRLCSGGGEAAQKRAFVESLGAESVVAVGNGANDAGMLQIAALGIAVLGSEGTATRALLAADVVVQDICAALDLLLKPQRLIAILRC
jgi:P-type E1-E2 ATPase